MGTFGIPRFHLRRIGPPSTRPENPDIIEFDKTITTIGRHPSQSEYVISSSDFHQNAIISRLHARVVKGYDNSHKLFDDSKNGIFVNCTKIEGFIILNEGDTVTFGHRNGERLPAGTRVRQPDSEYQFLFESCSCEPRRERSSRPTTPSNLAPIRYDRTRSPTPGSHALRPPSRGRSPTIRASSPMTRSYVITPPSRSRGLQRVSPAPAHLAQPVDLTTPSPGSSSENQDLAFYALQNRTTLPSRWTGTPDLHSLVGSSQLVQVSPTEYPALTPFCPTPSQHAQQVLLQITSVNGNHRAEPTAGQLGHVNSETYQTGAQGNIFDINHSFPLVLTGQNLGAQHLAQEADTGVAHALNERNNLSCSPVIVCRAASMPTNSRPCDVAMLGRIKSEASVRATYPACDMAVQASAASETTVRETTSPICDMAVQASVASETTVRETISPACDTAVQVSIASETTVKETISSETTVKETISSKTTVKETTSPVCDMAVQASVSSETTVKEAISPACDMAVQASVASETTVRETISPACDMEVQASVASETTVKETISSETTVRETTSPACDMAVQASIASETTVRETTSPACDMPVQATVEIETTAREITSQTSDMTVLGNSESKTTVTETTSPACDMPVQDTVEIETTAREATSPACDMPVQAITEEENEISSAPAENVTPDTSMHETGISDPPTAITTEFNTDETELSCAHADHITLEVNMAEKEISSAPSDHVTLEVNMAEKEISPAPADHVTSEVNMDEKEISPAPSDHVTSEVNMDEKEISPAPSDHVTSDVNMAEKEISSAPSDHVTSEVNMNEKEISPAPADHVTSEVNMNEKEISPAPADHVTSEVNMNEKEISLAPADQVTSEVNMDEKEISHAPSDHVTSEVNMDEKEISSAPADHVTSEVNMAEKEISPAPSDHVTSEVNMDEKEISPAPTDHITSEVNNDEKEISSAPADQVTSEVNMAEKEISPAPSDHVTWEVNIDEKEISPALGDHVTSEVNMDEKEISHAPADHVTSVVNNDEKEISSAPADHVTLEVNMAEKEIFSAPADHVSSEVNMAEKEISPAPSDQVTPEVNIEEKEISPALGDHVTSEVNNDEKEISSAPDDHVTSEVNNDEKEISLSPADHVTSEVNMAEKEISPAPSDHVTSEVNIDEKEISSALCDHITSVVNMNEKEISPAPSDHITSEVNMAEKEISSAPSDHVTSEVNMNEKEISRAPADHVTSEVNMNEKEISLAPADQVTSEVNMDEKEISPAPSDHVTSKVTMDEKEISPAPADHVTSEVNMDEKEISSSPARNITSDTNTDNNEITRSPEETISSEVGITEHDISCVPSEHAIFGNSMDDKKISIVQSEDVPSDHNKENRVSCVPDKDTAIDDSMDKNEVLHVCAPGKTYTHTLEDSSNEKEVSLAPMECDVNLGPSCLQKDLKSQVNGGMPLGSPAKEAYLLLGLDEEVIPNEEESDDLTDANDGNTWNRDVAEMENTLSVVLPSEDNIHVCEAPSNDMEDSAEYDLASNHDRTRELPKTLAEETCVAENQSSIHIEKIQEKTDFAASEMEVECSVGQDTNSNSDLSHQQTIAHEDYQQTTTEDKMTHNSDETLEKNLKDKTPTDEKLSERNDSSVGKQTDASVEITECAFICGPVTERTEQENMRKTGKANQNETSLEIPTSVLKVNKEQIEAQNDSTTKVGVSDSDISEADDFKLSFPFEHYSSTPSKDVSKPESNTVSDSDQTLDMDALDAEEQCEDINSDVTLPLETSSCRSDVENVKSPFSDDADITPEIELSDDEYGATQPFRAASRIQNMAEKTGTVDNDVTPDMDDLCSMEGDEDDPDKTLHTEVECVAGKEVLDRTLDNEGESDRDIGHEDPNRTKDFDTGESSQESMDGNCLDRTRGFGVDGKDKINVTKFGSLDTTLCEDGSPPPPKHNAEDMFDEQLDEKNPYVAMSNQLADGSRDSGVTPRHEGARMHFENGKDKFATTPTKETNYALLESPSNAADDPVDTMEECEESAALNDSRRGQDGVLEDGAKENSCASVEDKECSVEISQEKVHPEVCFNSCQNDVNKQDSLDVYQYSSESSALRNKYDHGNTEELFENEPLASVNSGTNEDISAETNMNVTHAEHHLDKEVEGESCLDSTLENDNDDIHVHVGTDIEEAENESCSNSTLEEDKADIDVGNGGIKPESCLNSAFDEGKGDIGMPHDEVENNGCLDSVLENANGDKGIEDLQDESCLNSTLEGNKDDVGMVSEEVEDEKCLNATLVEVINTTSLNNEENAAESSQNSSLADDNSNVSLIVNYSREIHKSDSIEYDFSEDENNGEDYMEDDYSSEVTGASLEDLQKYPTEAQVSSGSDEQIVSLQIEHSNRQDSDMHDNTCDVEKNNEDSLQSVPAVVESPSKEQEDSNMPVSGNQMPEEETASSPTKSFPVLERGEGEDKCFLEKSCQLFSKLENSAGDLCPSPGPVNSACEQLTEPHTERDGRLKPETCMQHEIIIRTIKTLEENFNTSSKEEQVSTVTAVSDEETNVSQDFAECEELPHGPQVDQSPNGEDHEMGDLSPIFEKRVSNMGPSFAQKLHFKDDEKLALDRFSTSEKDLEELEVKEVKSHICGEQSNGETSIYEERSEDKSPICEENVKKDSSVCENPSGGGSSVYNERVATISEEHGQEDCPISEEQSKGDLSASDEQCKDGLPICIRNEGNSPISDKQNEEIPPICEETRDEPPMCDKQRASLVFEKEREETTMCDNPNNEDELCNENLTNCESPSNDTLIPDEPSQDDLPLCKNNGEQDGNQTGEKLVFLDAKAVKEKGNYTDRETNVTPNVPEMFKGTSSHQGEIAAVVSTDIPKSVDKTPDGKMTVDIQRQSGTIDKTSTGEVTVEISRVSPAEYGAFDKTSDGEISVNVSTDVQEEMDAIDKTSDGEVSVKISTDIQEESDAIEKPSVSRIPVKFPTDVQEERDAIDKTSDVDIAVKISADIQKDSDPVDRTSDGELIVELPTDIQEENNTIDKTSNGEITVGVFTDNKDESDAIEKPSDGEIAVEVPTVIQEENGATDMSHGEIAVEISRVSQEENGAIEKMLHDKITVEVSTVLQEENSAVDKISHGDFACETDNEVCDQLDNVEIEHFHAATGYDVELSKTKEGTSRELEQNLTSQTPEISDKDSVPICAEQDDENSINSGESPLETLTGIPENVAKPCNEIELESYKKGEQKEIKNTFPQKEQDGGCFEAVEEGQFDDAESDDSSEQQPPAKKRAISSAEPVMQIKNYSQFSSTFSSPTVKNSGNSGLFSTGFKDLCSKPERAGSASPGFQIPSSKLPGVKEATEEDKLSIKTSNTGKRKFDNIRSNHVSDSTDPACDSPNKKTCTSLDLSRINVSLVEHSVIKVTCEDKASMEDACPVNVNPTCADNVAPIQDAGPVNVNPSCADNVAPIQDAGPINVNPSCTDNVAPIQDAGPINVNPSCEDEASMEDACPINVNPSCEDEASMEDAGLVNVNPSFEDGASVEDACPINVNPSCEDEASMEDAGLVNVNPSFEDGASVEDAGPINVNPSCENEASVEDAGPINVNPSCEDEASMENAHPVNVNHSCEYEASVEDTGPINVNPSCEDVASMEDAHPVNVNPSCADHVAPIQDVGPINVNPSCADNVALIEDAGPINVNPSCEDESSMEDTGPINVNPSCEVETSMEDACPVNVNPACADSVAPVQDAGPINVNPSMEDACPANVNPACADSVAPIQDAGPLNANPSCADNVGPIEDVGPVNVNPSCEDNVTPVEDCGPLNVNLLCAGNGASIEDAGSVNVNPSCEVNVAPAEDDVLGKSTEKKNLDCENKTKEDHHPTLQIPENAGVVMEETQSSMTPVDEDSSLHLYLELSQMGCTQSSQRTTLVSTSVEDEELSLSQDPVEEGSQDSVLNLLHDKSQELSIPDPELYVPTDLDQPVVTSPGMSCERKEEPPSGSTCQIENTDITNHENTVKGDEMRSKEIDANTQINCNRINVPTTPEYNSEDSFDNEEQMESVDLAMSDSEKSSQQKHPEDDLPLSGFAALSDSDDDATPAASGRSVCSNSGCVSDVFAEYQMPALQLENPDSGRNASSNGGSGSDCDVFAEYQMPTLQLENSEDPNMDAEDVEDTALCRSPEIPFCGKGTGPSTESSSPDAPSDPQQASSSLNMSQVSCSFDEENYEEFSAPPLDLDCLLSQQSSTEGFVAFSIYTEPEGPSSKLSSMPPAKTTSSTEFDYGEMHCDGQKEEPASNNPKSLNNAKHREQAFKKPETGSNKKSKMRVRTENPSLADKGISTKTDKSNNRKRKKTSDSFCSEDSGSDGDLPEALPLHVALPDLDQPEERPKKMARQSPSHQFPDPMHCAAAPSTSVDTSLLSVKVEKDEKPTRSGGNSRVNAVLERMRAKHGAKKAPKEEPQPGTSQDVISLPVKERKRLREAPNLTLDNAEDCMRRVRQVLEKLEDTLDCKPRLNFLPRVGAWQKEVQNLKKKTTLPKTVIAVVGITGSGKSSLMNSLLDHADILPTSGMRACTAVVVEICNNEDNDFYAADIEFLDRKEWYDELKDLLSELTMKDGRVRARQSDPSAEVAWSKIRAVYGVFSDKVTFNQLARQQTVTRWLGKTKKIVDHCPKEFRRQVDKYIESTDAGTGDQFWPIVRHVRLRIPNCGVCSSGATLVDLPGIRDSNAARDRIAKEYLRNCNAVWVVADIQRAVDCKTAKELLGEHFRRQLLMDGQYGSVSFICTKTDILIPSELRRALNVREECRPHEDALNSLDLELVPMKDSLHMIEEEAKQLDNQIRELESEKIDLTTDLDDLALALSQTEDNDSFEAQEQEFHNLVEEKNSTIVESKSQLRSVNCEKKEKNKAILEIKNQISEHRRSIAAICARARNEYAKGQIRRDFKAGLKELKRRAGMLPDQDDDDDDVDLDDDNEDDDLNYTVENMKVFCVSSVEYLKMKELLPQDGPPQVFRDPEESGVPMLKAFVHSMTEVRRLQGTERVIRSVGQFVSDIQTYLSDEGTKSDVLRDGVRSLFEESLKNLEKNLFPKIVENIGGKIDKCLHDNLLTKMAEGVKTAVREADNTTNKWGSPVNRENKKEGGLCWATYKAVCRRLGVFESKASGPIDFNEDLASPLLVTISFPWEKIFNSLLWQILDSFRQAVLIAIKVFGNQLREQLLVLGMARDRLDRVIEQHLASTGTKLAETLMLLKDFITEQQRELNRLMMPVVQNHMTPAYNQCSNESGSGSFTRMKGHMSSHVTFSKNIMFDQASEQLLSQLKKLKKEILSGLRETLNDLLAEMTALYEPLWEEPTNTRLLKESFYLRVQICHNMMQKLYSDAKINSVGPAQAIHSGSSSEQRIHASSSTCSSNTSKVETLYERVPSAGGLPIKPEMTYSPRRTSTLYCQTASATHADLMPSPSVPGINRGVKATCTASGSKTARVSTALNNISNLALVKQEAESPAKRKRPNTGLIDLTNSSDEDEDRKHHFKYPRI